MNNDADNKIKKYDYNYQKEIYLRTFEDIIEQFNECFCSEIDFEDYKQLITESFDCDLLVNGFYITIDDLDWIYNHYYDIFYKVDDKLDEFEFGKICDKYSHFINITDRIVLI